MKKRTSKFGDFYGCVRFPECDATHGCHSNGVPLGVPADKETRQARVCAHETFDALWKHDYMKRSEAYKWMKAVMGDEKAHIGNLNKEDCSKLIQTVMLYLRGKRTMGKTTLDAAMVFEEARQAMEDRND